MGNLRHDFGSTFRLKHSWYPPSLIKNIKSLVEMLGCFVALCSFGRLWCSVYLMLNCLDVEVSLCGSVVMWLCRYGVVLICGCVKICSVK